MSEVSPETPQDPKKEVIVTVESIPLSEFPPKMVELLREGINDRTIEANNTEVEFTLKATTEDGVVSYAAGITIFSPEAGEKGKEILMADFDGEQVVGLGSLFFQTQSQDPNFKDQPYVSWTETKRSFRGQGLALRRLHVLNQISLQQWRHPIRSGFIIEEGAKAVWEKLIAGEQAEKFVVEDEIEGPKTIYRFK